MNLEQQMIPEQFEQSGQPDANENIEKSYLPIKQYQLIYRHNLKPLRIAFYKCLFCGTRYKRQKQRAIDHMRTNCQNKKLMDNKIQNQNLQEMIIQNLRKQRLKLKQQEEKPFKGRKIRKLEQDIKKLKSKVNVLQNTPGKNAFQKKNTASQLGKQIWQQVSEIIKPHIIYKISEQIMNFLSCQVLTPEQIRKNFVSQLVDKVIQMNLKGFLTTWQQKVANCLEQVISLLNNTSRQHKSRNLTASHFIRLFSEYELTTNQTRFIDEVKNLSVYKRTNVILLYHKLEKKFPFLNLMPLPINLPIYTFTNQRSIVDIFQVKLLILKTWQTNKELACDLNFCLNMGLRRTELMRVRLKDENGAYFRMIKIFQQKNRNMTTRIICQSLITMCIQSNIQFPLTIDRFKKVRQFSLGKLSQFYGLRHTCLTNLTRTLLQNSELNIHKQSRTTIQRYVNLQLCGQVSKTFEISNFTEVGQNIKINYSEKYMIFNQFDIDYDKLSNSQLFIQQESNQDQIQDKLTDSNLSNSFQPQIFTSRQIEKQVKLNLKSSQFVYQNFHQQLISTYLTQIEMINDLTDRSVLSVSEINQQLTKGQQVVSYKLYMYLLSQILNLSFKTFFFKQHNDQIEFEQVLSTIQSQNRIQTQAIQQKTVSQLEVQKTQEKPLQNESEKNLIIISKQIQKLMISENIDKIVPKYEQKPKRKRAENHNISQYTLQIGLPYCTKCFQCYMQPLNKKNNSFLVCSKCKYKTSPALQSQKMLRQDGQVKIFLSRPHIYSSLNHKSIQIQKKRNNLKAFVENQFGLNSFSNKAIYGKDVPTKIRTNMTLHSNFTSKQIEYNLKNEEFLPLEIKQSTLPGAGKGLFCLQKIKNSMMIIVYSGVIKTQKTVDISNDSLYIIGALIPDYDYQEPSQILIEPKIKLNSARYINTAPKEKINACPIIGMVKTEQNGQDSLGMAILYIYSIRQIEAGEQIFYDYGDLYRLILTQFEE